MNEKRIAEHKGIFDWNKTGIIMACHLHSNIDIANFSADVILHSHSIIIHSLLARLLLK